MKSIESTDPRPSENDILEFENRWNLQLPQDYRSFLLKHNGGRPFPAMFPISGMENNPEGQVQDFFGLGTAIKSYDLNWVLENLGVPQPDGLLPVGCNASGDYLCISTKSGRVLFWDRMACWGK